MKFWYFLVTENLNGKNISNATIPAKVNIEIKSILVPMMKEIIVSLKVSDVKSSKYIKYRESLSRKSDTKLIVK